MKYVFVFSVIIMLCLSGCSKNEKAESRQAEWKTQASPPAEIKTETLVSEAQTVLYDRGENRINNIKLASDSINGWRIAAGDTFSFNAAVGERTEERGYRKAPVLLYGEREYDYGGGVCQVSTTLYQAALSGGFEITERHGHKKEVNYAKEGEDAAVNYNSLDFKFVNNRNTEIVIYTGVYEECVVVQICSLNIVN